MQTVATGAHDLERLRELHRQDREVRTAHAVDGENQDQLDGSPQYDLEFGRLGRAYAVGEGAKIDPPDTHSAEPAQQRYGRTPVGEAHAAEAYRAAANLPSAPGGTGLGAATDTFG